MYSINNTVKITAAIAIAALLWQGYMIYDLKSTLDKQGVLAQNSQKSDSADSFDHSLSVSLLKNRSVDSFFSEFQQMQEEFDKVFGRVNSYFANDPLFKTAFDNSFHQPLIDISSNSDEYIIKMDIPGVKSSDIDIKAENNILTVKAELDEYKESNSTTFIRKERYANRFLRELSLSNDVDSSKMKHEYKDGVLTIMLPKK